MEDETDALLAALATGEFHAAFVGMGPGTEPPPEFEARVVAREPTMLAVHPEHPFAARRSVRLAALRDEPFVTLTHASRLRGVLEAMCAAGGLRPLDRRRDDRPAVMVMLAAEGVGVALLPRSASRAPPASPRSTSRTRASSAASSSSGAPTTCRPRRVRSWSWRAASSNSGYQGEMKLETLVGRALIGGLCVAAAAAIVALLVGDFGDTAWRVILASLGSARSRRWGEWGCAAPAGRGLARGGRHRHDRGGGARLRAAARRHLGGR